MQGIGLKHFVEVLPNGYDTMLDDHLLFRRQKQQSPLLEL